VPQSLVRYAYTVNNPLRYVDPTGEFFFNPQLWGAAWQGFSDAVHGAAAAVGDWWASSSIWDKLDMAMTIVGFIPGLDVVSDAYFLGKAILDVVQGRGSWADVAMNAAFLLAPAVGGAVFRVAKTAFNALDGAADAARAINKADNLADGAKAVGKADGTGGLARTAKGGSSGGPPPHGGAPGMGGKVGTFPDDPSKLPPTWKKGPWTDVPDSAGGGKQMIVDTPSRHRVVVHTGHPSQDVHKTLHYHVYAGDPLRPGRFPNKIGTYGPGDTFPPGLY
jgi:hypothetical protein